MQCRSLKKFGLIIVELLLGFAMTAHTAQSQQISAAASPKIDAQKLYQEHCETCHGLGRLGQNGPPLLPENLQRTKKQQAFEAIAKGLAATQMPGFAGKLNDADIHSLVELIYTPLPEVPNWGFEELNASHTILNTGETRIDKPVYDSDPLNIFVVVETGDHHATILDGDTFEPITRFPTRRALHGGPKFTADGRFVYFASRDGWISKFDLYSLKTVAEIRAGIYTRNIAISGDGRYVLVGNYLPHTLVILDSIDLSLIKVIPVYDAASKRSSRVSAVYQAAPRDSFIVALKDIPEVWEIAYDKNAKINEAAMVHDYRKDSGESPMSEFTQFNIRKIQLDDYLDDFFFDQNYIYLVGSARNAGQGQVIYLDGQRKIADIKFTGLPHLGSGISWEHKGRTVIASPNLKESAVSIIDIKSWKIIKQIKTHAPGFFIRSHENSLYAWVDVFFGPNKDALHIIDKQSLEIIKTVKPSPGKTAAHVEFTRDGRYALVSIWEMDGAIVVYDAKSLEEVKRIPMKKPSGKYNVFNKISRSEGTSH